MHSTRIRELSPPNKRKMIMQIALHSDISSFSNGSTNSSGSGSITGPPDIIPEDLRSLYSNTPKERALVLYKPPSEFLPNLVNGSQAPSSPSSRSPKAPITNSFPLNNDNEESMDI
ncbi:Uncharacterized protein FKW44_019241 [Caligus rogercresseyi]|uniref:Uncharacterized protein n=1 Tax=Caligus rogercresseyi TaxID=217165 RepID=A0A7T8JXD8_CALRO|nr:Uncharacterized protein FKW44_019241 [Caligus rogercresseyi]